MSYRPLADEIRPQSLDEVVGQRHILGENGLLRRIIESEMCIRDRFKFYTIISFAVPFLMLGLPIFDTCFAFIRRIAHGQSPMHADRSHVHHRLIDMRCV